jgi:hypothetical protein
MRHVIRIFRRSARLLYDRAMRRRTLTLLACLTATTGACLPVGNYHTARTLPRGESSVGLTFSATTYTDESGDSLTIPGVIPEITYHIGVGQHAEVGGRIAPGFLYGELDVKYRFLQADRLHMAVAPAIGQMALGITLTTLRLPLILTYELSDMVSFNASLNGTTWRSSGSGDSTFEFYGGKEVFVTTGGSAGIEVTGETFFLRPSFELGTMVTDPGGGADRLRIGAVVIHFGWVSGREMKKLREMDEKLDRIEDKLGDDWKARPIVAAARD